MVGDDPHTGIAYAQVQVVALHGHSSGRDDHGPRGRNDEQPHAKVGAVIRRGELGDADRHRRSHPPKTTELIPSDKCVNGDPSKTGPNQCLHLWLTKVKKGTSCTIWFVYEVDKTEIANTMTKYQLDPSSPRPISRWERILRVTGPNARPLSAQHGVRAAGQRKSAEVLPRAVDVTERCGRRLIRWLVRM